MAATVAMMTAIAIATVETVIVEAAIVNMLTPNHVFNLFCIICIDSSLLFFN